MKFVVISFLSTLTFTIALAQESVGQPGTAPAVGTQNLNIDNLSQVIHSKAEGQKLSSEEAKEIFNSLTSPYEYSPGQRKNLFSPPEVLVPLDVLPQHGPFMALQSYPLDQIKVRGIIWNVKKPRALVEVPGGTIHTLTLGDRLGNRNGYVAVIREGEVVVIETVDRGGQAVSATRILNLKK